MPEDRERARSYLTRRERDLSTLWGYIHTIHALLPHFLDRGSGTIVNVGSIGGKIPIAYHVPYTTIAILNDFLYL
ncbi:SDR family NAD(P)-dependent oxidoreductase [Microcoleus sp. Pol11C2]|uniref:SDR family NAD(P)-dependent oxidoreductase n=1 Tax=Microcoleus sp. Pol11C2 TaxID=3055389 RepID=UPI002FD70025